MIRPDQEKFDRFARQVLVLDRPLERFCYANGFDLELNVHRTPCRVLRRQRQSMEIVDIYLDGDWKGMDYSELLPCTFSVCSYYEKSDESHKLYKTSRSLEKFSSFILLTSKIDALLQNALEIFDEWIPEVVMATGQEIENTRRMYYGGKLDD